MFFKLLIYLFIYLLTYLFFFIILNSGLSLSEAVVILNSLPIY